MKQFSKELGKVSVTPKGAWNINTTNERLDIVYDKRNNQAYIAKQNVPIGVDIDNREYWQPMNVTGYADNNFINLTTENEDGTITAYESLEEAVAKIFPINRRVGATLSFYNLNTDRLDRQAEFELWQFNSTDLANWENKNYWNNIYYNWNVFAGWYASVDSLENHVRIPNVGQYAYVGTNLNDALLYQCRTNGTWTNTGIKVRNYISVVVSGNITIGENGNWFSGGKDTGIPATPAVDEQLDDIIIQLQQHTTEISNLKKSDANLQDQITSNDSDITDLTAKHKSLSKTVQGIAATSGASTATNVTYNNDTSKLNAENAQDAIDELTSKKFDKGNIKQEIGNSIKDVVSQNVIFDNIRFPVIKFHKGMMEITNELGEDGNPTGNVQINVLQEIKYTVSSKQFRDIDFNKYYAISKKSYIFSLPSTQCILCWNYSNLQFEAYKLRQVHSGYCIPICFIYTYDDKKPRINIDLTDSIIGIRLKDYKTNVLTYFEINNLDAIHIRDIMPDDIENEPLHHYITYICKRIKTIYIDEGDYKIGNFFTNNNSPSIKYLSNKHVIGVNRDKCIIRAWDFNNNNSTKLIANSNWQNSVFENLTVYNCGFGNSLPESFYDNTFYITVKNVIFNITETIQSGYLNYVHNIHCIFEIRDCVVNVDANVRLFTAIYMDLGEKLIVDNCIINGLDKNDRSKQLITLPISISGTKNAIIKNNTVYGGTEGIITKIDRSKSLEHFTIEHNTVEGTKEEGISFDCFGNNVGLHPTICELSITSAEYIEYTLLESTNKSLKLYCTARNLKGSHPNETWQVYSLIEHKDYLKDFYIFFSNYAGDVFGGTICKCLDVGEDDKGVYVVADISFDPATLKLSEDTDPRVGTNDNKRTSNFKRASIVSGVFAMSVKNNIIRNTKGAGLALFCAIYNSVVDGNTFENCAGGSYLFSSIALTVAVFTPCCNNRIINNIIIGGGTTLGETGYGFTFYGYTEYEDMLCYNNVFANNYLNTNQLYINNVRNLILTGNILDGNTILRLKNSVETNVFGTKLPVAPLPGQHFFNTTTKKEMMYNGTEWIEVI